VEGGSHYLQHKKQKRREWTGQQSWDLGSLTLAKGRKVEEGGAALKLREQKWPYRGKKENWGGQSWRHNFIHQGRESKNKAKLRGGKRFAEMKDAKRAGLASKRQNFFTCLAGSPAKWMKRGGQNGP